MNKPLRTVEEVKAAKRRHQHEAEGGLGGAIAGAGVGSHGSTPAEGPMQTPES